MTEPLFAHPGLFLLTAAASVAATSLVMAVWGFRRRRFLVNTKLRQSRATLRGQVAEQVAPHLPGFPWAAADARFLGNPIDYLVIDGLSAEREELSVVLVEVKTGRAKASRVQRRIRDAVAAGRVSFEVVRIDR